MNLFFTDNQTAKPQTQNMMPGAREDLGEGLYPLDHIGGFDVRPGFFRMNGSYQTAKGVSFTVSSHGATSCTLLLFRPMAAEPYAKIRVPDNYKIGDTYSCLLYTSLQFLPGQAGFARIPAFFPVHLQAVQSHLCV